MHKQQKKSFSVADILDRLDESDLELSGSNDDDNDEEYRPNADEEEAALSDYVESAEESDDGEAQLGPSASGEPQQGPLPKKTVEAAKKINIQWIDETEEPFDAGRTTWDDQFDIGQNKLTFTV
jgi:beta-lactamase class A